MNTQFVNDDGVTIFNAGTSEGAKKGWEGRQTFGDQKSAEQGESGLRHEHVKKGDILTNHTEGAAFKKGDKFKVTGKTDWQVKAKHVDTGEEYKFGNNGLRSMTAERGG